MIKKMFKIKIILVILFNLLFKPSGSSNFDIELKNQKVRPDELMIDITNLLSYKIMYLHSISNRNNFAFSPCGLASILVALFEGSEGKTAIEIHQALELPWERDLTRIGFRDIHRRLRTFFYQNENILKGLSLSRENITIRPEYETVLRFYGYEVNLIKSGNDTKEDEEVSEDLNDYYDYDLSTMTTTQNTTQNLITNDIEINENTRKATMDLLLETSSMSTTSIEIVKPMTMPSSTEPIETTSIKSVIVTTSMPTTTDIPTTITTPLIYTFKPPLTTLSKTTLGLSTPPIVPITRIPASVAADLAKSNKTTTTYAPFSTVQPTRRASRSLLRTPRSSMSYEIISGYDSLNDYFPPATPNPPGQSFDFNDEFKLIFKDELPPQNYYSSSNNGYDTNSEKDLIHFFYLNPRETIQIPYKFYNTILNFAYIEEVRSSVLQLELDSENYNLMIILPDYDYGLDRLLETLKLHSIPKLRDVKRKLNKTWVKAIVPKFNLKGNIILTRDLQSMGIHDVFEPTHADLSPMTADELVYARHIEQSITVNIRTQKMEQMKRHSNFYKSPVEISINHPFLFFIIDKELDLAIISGRILNPLNSRIQ